jgi:hypothetical protein
MKVDDAGLPKAGMTQHKNTTLIAYNGSVIQQHGSIIIGYAYDNSPWHEEEFYVTDVNGPAILGLRGSTKLKLVSLHCPIQTSPRQTEPSKIRDEQHLQQQYPDRFKGIGDFSGEMHITLTETVNLLYNLRADTPSNWYQRSTKNCRRWNHSESSSELNSPQTG